MSARTDSARFDRETARESRCAETTSADRQLWRAPWTDGCQSSAANRPAASAYRVLICRHPTSTLDRSPFSDGVRSGHACGVLGGTQVGAKHSTRPNSAGIAPNARSGAPTQARVPAQNDECSAGSCVVSHSRCLQFSDSRFDERRRPAMCGLRGPDRQRLLGRSGRVPVRREMRERAFDQTLPQLSQIPAVHRNQGRAVSTAQPHTFRIQYRDSAERCP